MTPVLNPQSPGRDLKVRYVWLGLAMVGGLLVLAVQLYRLQIIRGEEFAARSVANFVKETRILAERGMIKDSQGQILVQNRPSFDVFVTPAFCQECATDVLPRLGGLLGWDEAALKKTVEDVKAARRKAPFRPLAVRIDLNRDELDLLAAHLRSLPGVEVEAVPHRSYRTGTVLAHVLGYMNEISERELERLSTPERPYQLGDYVGRAGLEKSFESTLRGTNGLRRQVVDARGRSLPDLQWLIDEQEVAPSPGNNLVLSIDMRLQEAAEQAFPGVTGAVVAVDVKTGFIKAMVSRPAFDPNVLTGRVTPQQMAALTGDPLKPMVFRPTFNHFAPGSIFKPITNLAAMRSGVLSQHSTATCHGGYRLGRRTWRCHSARGHGVVNGKTALQYSCDVWYYKVADTLGLDPIAKVGDEFGLGHPTGIGVVGEVPGIMPTEAFHDRVNKSSGGYTKGLALNSAMGQGAVTVTPLQMALVYAAIANGGDVFVPQLVEAIEDPHGQVVQRFEPKVARHVEMTAEQRQALVEGLVAVVHEPGGTAFRHRLPDVKVAGKTGTAQVTRIGAVRLKKHQMEYWQRDHAWFAAFAPADEPEIAVVVLNEHGGSGSKDAAPTGMALLQKYFELKREKALGEQGLTLPESVQLSAQEPGASAVRPPAAAARRAPVREPAAPAAAEAIPARAVAPAAAGAVPTRAVATSATGLPVAPLPLAPVPAPPAAPAASPAPAQRADGEEH